MGPRKKEYLGHARGVLPPLREATVCPCGPTADTTRGGHPHRSIRPCSDPFPALALFQQTEAPACPGHIFPLGTSVGQAPTHPGPAGRLALGPAPWASQLFHSHTQDAVLSVVLTKGLLGQAEVRAQLWGSADLGQLAALTAFSWLGVTSPL